MPLIIPTSVAMIDEKPWKMMGPQRNHHWKMEMLLAEIFDRVVSK